MAGDWIKMRGALLDHPKVIRISKELELNSEFREWLTPGGAGNGQLVSNQALRCVTVALLMRCWSLSREHGEFHGDDLLLRYLTLDGLDEMAGAPGVGKAMSIVKWAIKHRSKSGVTLPNFREFNVPMTSAEKQKEYRERNRTVTETVTSALHENSENVTPREEKRREEKSIKKKKPPNPLAGAFASRWELYPNSIGRKAAERHFLASVTTEADLQDLDKALANYRRCLERNPDRPMQNGSTWFNNWRDWVTYEGPKQGALLTPDEEERELEEVRKIFRKTP